MRPVAICIAASLAILPARPADGQSLIDQYRDARFQAEVERIFEERGMRAKPRPVAHLASAADSLATWWDGTRGEDQTVQSAPPVARFERARWRHIRRLERGWFERTFQDVQWSYLGNSLRSPIDTTRTPELRARLEERFGPPTVTVADALEAGAVQVDEYVQFEYWAVVNDSIAVRIMDVGGPLDRGLILVAPREMRDDMRALRSALERELFGVTPTTAYTDYYFDELAEAWYETGFDGKRVYTTRISRPPLIRGRPGSSSNK